jgi:SAM-dependent methyltransferase
MYFALMLLFAMILTPLIETTTPAEAKPPLKGAINRQKFRNEYTRFETIIDALDITPGMSILDIGAGPGYASFVFAEKLRGSGAVYATDIRKDFVDHIADEAKKRGLTNLFSAVVKDDGLDDFYSKHRYDLVFLSNVYHCLDSRIDYFNKLRQLLKPNARLVFILYNQVPLYTAADVADIEELANSLAKEAADSPFMRHLSNATRQLLKDETKREALLKPMVDDFNGMLTDPGFYKDFYRDFYFRKDFFTPAERDFANWLLMTIKEAGVPEKSGERIDDKGMRLVIKLNRLFISKRFGEFLEKDGMGAYIPAGDANRHTSKYVTFRELDAAGFKLIREIKLSPYYDAVIMAPKSP